MRAESKVVRRCLAVLGAVCALAGVGSSFRRCSHAIVAGPAHCVRSSEGGSPLAPALMVLGVSCLALAVVLAVKARRTARYAE